VAGTIVQIKAYASALMLLQSSRPEHHKEAFQVIDGMPRRRDGSPQIEIYRGVPGRTPARISDYPDRRLVAFARGSDAKLSDAARTELARRGSIVIYGFVFMEGYELAKWNMAKNELKKLGLAGLVNMAYSLMGVLLEPKRRPHWQQAVIFYAETGEPGYRVARSTFERYLKPSIPDDDYPYPHEAKPTQVFAALIQLGPQAREYVLELSKSPKAWQRRCIANAIAITKDISLVDVLKDYARDPHFLVRATAFKVFGQLPELGSEGVEALVAALPAETDEIVLDKISEALARLNARSAVPKLIEIVDHPNYRIVRVIIKALTTLTRARGLQTPREWKVWWERNRHQWEKQE
jgi:hypothetical protein